MSVMRAAVLLSLLVQTGAPAPAAIVQRYVEALGGEAALRAVRTRVSTGRFDNGRGLVTTFTIFERAPAARATILGTAPIGSPSGSGRGYDGTSGWDKSFVGTGLRAVTGPELDDLAREADVLAPLHLLVGCTSPRAEQAADADVIRCQPDKGPAFSYSFSRKTGLLERYEVPAGRRGPFTIRYEDYRTVDGVRLPFTWVIGVGGGRITYTASSIRHNDSIDDGVFARPAQ